MIWQTRGSFFRHASRGVKHDDAMETQSTESHQPSSDSSVSDSGSMEMSSNSSDPSLSHEISPSRSALSGLSQGMTLAELEDDGNLGQDGIGSADVDDQVDDEGENLDYLEDENDAERQFLSSEVLRVV